jgi:hypothetical protein
MLNSQPLTRRHVTWQALATFAQKHASRRLTGLNATVSTITVSIGVGNHPFCRAVGGGVVCAGGRSVNAGIYGLRDVICAVFVLMEGYEQCSNSACCFTVGVCTMLTGRAGVTCSMT